MADPVTVLVLREMRKQLYPQETLKIDALDTALAALVLVQQYLAWVDRHPDRECMASIEERMRALLAQETTYD